MTQIDFYIGVQDKMHTACRLAAKAFSHNLRVMVFCPEAETAQRFDRLLWTSPATGFIPHCLSSDPLAPVTPVIVGHDGEDPHHDQVLLNLRAEWPAFFSRFHRLIEIVTLGDEDKANARARFKFYRDRGYAIRTHDLSQAD
jgi:DNA polymerase-3 subunit chi